MNTRIREAMGYKNILEVGETVYGASPVTRYGRGQVISLVINEDEYIITSVGNTVKERITCCPSERYQSVSAKYLEIQFNVLVDNSEEMVASIQAAIIERMMADEAITDPADKVKA